MPPTGITDSGDTISIHRPTEGPTRPAGYTQEPRLQEQLKEAVAAVGEFAEDPDPESLQDLNARLQVLGLPKVDTSRGQFNPRYDPELGLRPSLDQFQAGALAVDLATLTLVADSEATAEQLAWVYGTLAANAVRIGAAMRYLI